MKKILIIGSLILLVGGVYYLMQDSSLSNTLTNSEEISSSTENENFIGTFCFSYLQKTPNTTDQRDIMLVINNDGTVSGTKTGYSQNPEYSVGYEGTFEGEISNTGIINAVATLRIADGGENIQEERYELRNEILTELRYAYTEDFSANILRIDESVHDNGQGLVFPIKTAYQYVDCE